MKKMCRMKCTTSAASRPFFNKKKFTKKMVIFGKKIFRKNRKKSQKNDKNPGSVIGLNFVKKRKF